MSRTMRHNRWGEVVNDREGVHNKILKRHGRRMERHVLNLIDDEDDVALLSAKVNSEKRINHPIVINKYW